MKFLRTDSSRFSRLGKNRKKMQKWRAALGNQSKIRKKRRGYPARPVIGYSSPRKGRGLFNGLKSKLVFNIKDLENAKGHAVIIASKVGAKNRIELLKKAEFLQLKVLNQGGKR